MFEKKNGALVLQNITFPQYMFEQSNIFSTYVLRNLKKQSLSFLIASFLSLAAKYKLIIKFTFDIGIQYYSLLVAFQGLLCTCLQENSSNHLTILFGSLKESFGIFFSHIWSKMSNHCTPAINIFQLSAFILRVGHQLYYQMITTV